MRVPRILAIVLAGGEGSRLGALTEHRAKPALPIGGTYRLIDVALSNLMHSHVSDVWLVQQYLPHSLNAHLANGRPWDLDRSHGGLQVVAPFEGGEGEGFAEGNSDALFRQRHRIREFDPDLVLVLSADHLYTLNLLDVVDTHLRQRADLTMVTTEIAEDASRFAVVQADDAGRITRFDYKPDEPEGRLVAAELFLFDTDVLLEALDVVHDEHGQLGDYGEDLLPWYVANCRVVEHRLEGYWMDLGTPQSYWTAHMELLDGTGATLDDPGWPILSAQPQLLPARVLDGATVKDSMLAAGSRVGGTAEHSVIGTGAVVEPGATVRHSVLLDGVQVSAGAVLDHVVADSGARIPAGEHGRPGTVTVIDAEGAASTTDLDRAAALPAGE